MGIVLQTFTKMFRMVAEVLQVSAHGVLSQASFLDGGGILALMQEQPGCFEATEGSEGKCLR